MKTGLPRHFAVYCRFCVDRFQCDIFSLTFTFSHVSCYPDLAQVFSFDVILPWSKDLVWQVQEPIKQRERHCQYNMKRIINMIFFNWFHHMVKDTSLNQMKRIHNMKNGKNMTVLSHILGLIWVWWENHFGVPILSWRNISQASSRSLQTFYPVMA